MSIIDLKIDKLSYQADLDRHYFLSHFFTDDAFEHIIDFLLEDESCIYYDMLSESINDDFIELLSPSLAMRILFPTYHDSLNNEICESYLLDNSIYIPCKENVVIGLFANCVIQPLSINAISEASRSLTEGVNSHEIEALKNIDMYYDDMLFDVKVRLSKSLSKMDEDYANFTNDIRQFVET